MNFETFCIPVLVRQALPGSRSSIAWRLLCHSCTPVTLSPDNRLVLRERVCPWEGGGPQRLSSALSLYDMLD
eukprot:746367-Hanusia_phi.AAC.1